MTARPQPVARRDPYPGPGPQDRPRLLVVVSGTGTEVGKTWFTAATATALRARGRRVSVRKPVQSGRPGTATDAEMLAAATDEDPVRVCPSARSYEIPWAPPMAADELGLPPFSVADLVAETTWDAGTDVGLVEGVGGPRSPIASDGDTVDLTDTLHPDLVVLVADAGLGTINSVRLSAAVFADRRLVVALNRFGADPLHERNRDHLARVERLDVVTSPAALADRVLRELDERP